MAGFGFLLATSQGWGASDVALQTGLDEMKIQLGDKNTKIDWAEEALVGWTKGNVTKIFTRNPVVE